ncbi:hypothetical protein HDU85_001142 [Gaertneriomyces sp. JEL0708]|nr:hypothetical protein HDU85_001142 [Gaertneriomyces sp. JEL0708]
MTQNWEPGLAYSSGDVVHYCGSDYRIIQPHTSQGDWTPDRTPALWGKIPGGHKQQNSHQQGGCQPQNGGYQQAPQHCPPGQQQGGYQQSPQHCPPGQQQGGYQQSPQNQQQPQYGGMVGSVGSQPHYGNQPSNNTGGYGAIPPVVPPPSETDDPRKKKKFDIAGFSIDEDKLKIGGGIIGTAAAIGIGAFAYDKYQDSKEASTQQQWSESNWLQEAQFRQGQYLEAVKNNTSLPPVTWVLTEAGKIPAGAIVGGHEADNTPLYIGRAFQGNGVHIGKVAAKWNEGCMIPWGGKEVAKKQFEILLGYENAVKWVDIQGSCKVDRLNAKPVEGGREADGTPLYVAQAMVKGGVIVGKASENLNGAMIPYGGDERKEKSYRVLCYR